MLCIVFDGSPSIPEARCRLFSAERKWNDGKLCDWRGAFSFGECMSDILTSANAYSQLLDIEYHIVLGKKKKNIPLSITFEKDHFFHLAGLHYLTDRTTLLYGDRAQLFHKILNGTITAQQIETSKFYSNIKDRIAYLAYLEALMDSNETVFKYNPRLDAFSAIQADFLLKNEMQSRNIFTFLSSDKASGKYFCRSFFPQTDKDYSQNQTTWTLLYKKKIHKSTGQEEALFNRLRK